MKFIYVIVFATVFSSQRLEAQAPSTDITFEERVHNFGTIKEEQGKVSHTFVFQNKGKTPVLVNEVNSACGCIGKVITKGAVQPGEKGKVTITFDPGYKSGFFSKEIVVLSNNGKEYNRIWVEGNIVPAEHPIEEDYPYNFGGGLYLRLKVMAFGYLKPGETGHMDLHYANATNKEMNLNFNVAENKPGLKFSNPGKIAPKGKGVIRFTFTMQATSRGDAFFTIHPLINNRKLTESVQVRILNDATNKSNENQKSSVKDRGK
jgi:hypothetical protein